MESRKGRDAVAQHALLPSDSPLEKTPHKAGVVSVAPMAAVVTLLEMASQDSSPADLDRGHGAALRRGERSAVLLTIGFAVAAKHIRHLKLGAIHVPELEVLWWSGLGLRGNWLREQIERAGSGAHFAGSDA
jgi:hypothetical protein